MSFINHTYFIHNSFLMYLSYSFHILISISGCFLLLPLACYDRRHDGWERKKLFRSIPALLLSSAQVPWASCSWDFQTEVCLLFSGRIPPNLQARKCMPVWLPALLEEVLMCLTHILAPGLCLHESVQETQKKESRRMEKSHFKGQTQEHTDTVSCHTIFIVYFWYSLLYLFLLKLTFVVFIPSVVLNKEISPRRDQYTYHLILSYLILLPTEICIPTLSLYPSTHFL